MSRSNEINRSAISEVAIEGVDIMALGGHFRTGQIGQLVVGV